MSGRLYFMSFSINNRVNVGAYEKPFSGVGIEFDPLGVKPGRTGITLHEAGYLEANSNWNFPGVFSPFWRFYFNEKRGHCVLFGEKMTELTPQHIMIIPPHRMFHCLGANPVSNFWMAFSFTRQIHADVSIPILLSPRDTELCLIRDIRSLILKNPQYEPTDAIFRNSLALLQVVLSRPELTWQPPLPEGLERVKRHMEENLHSKLSMQSLAQLAGMSQPVFNRTFKRHFGSSPGQYLTEIRIRESAHLLLQTKATIDDIATQTGFPNRAYFSRVFSHVTGESPAHFRNKRQGNKT